MKSSTAPLVSPPSRRERERSFRNRLVLEAAEEVFAAHGFQRASVEEIARRSEIAIATLYKLFGSKEDIFAALVEHRQDEFLEEVGRFARTGSTPQAQIERLIEAVFHYFDRHQAAFRIYLGATHGFPWHIRSSLGDRSFAKYQEFVKRLATLIDAGIQHGAWPPTDDSARLAVAAMGVLNGLLTRRHTDKARGNLDEEITYANSLIARLLGISAAPGLRPRPGGRRA